MYQNHPLIFLWCFRQIQAYALGHVEAFLDDSASHQTRGELDPRLRCTETFKLIPMQRRVLALSPASSNMSHGQNSLNYMELQRVLIKGLSGFTWEF